MDLNRSLEFNLTTMLIRFVDKVEIFSITIQVIIRRRYVKHVG